MAQIKKSDFIEIDYTGRIKGGVVFDTTIEAAAKENNIYTKGAEYKPIIICVGENHIVRGIDEQIEGKDLGKYTFAVSAEKGFGSKTAKLLQLISRSKFTAQRINPVPGLQVNIDGIVGIVKTVTGGRVIVDFNHPLSGRELEYEIEAKRIVTDEKEKVDALLKLINIRDFETTLSGDTAEIAIKAPLPMEIQQRISGEIARLTAAKKISFKKAEPKAEKKESTPNNAKPDVKTA